MKICGRKHALGGYTTAAEGGRARDMYFPTPTPLPPPPSPHIECAPQRSPGTLHSTKCALLC